MTHCVSKLMLCSFNRKSISTWDANGINQSKGVINWPIRYYRISDHIKAVIRKRGGSWSSLMEIFQCFIKPHICWAVLVSNGNSSKVDTVCILLARCTVRLDFTKCWSSRFNLHASISPIVAVLNFYFKAWLPVQFYCLPGYSEASAVSGACRCYPTMPIPLINRIQKLHRYPNHWLTVTIHTSIGCYLIGSSIQVTQNQ